MYVFGKYHQLVQVSDKLLVLAWIRSSCFSQRHDPTLNMVGAKAIRSKYHICNLTHPAPLDVLCHNMSLRLEK